MAQVTRPAPDQAESLRVLRAALDNGFDPVKLASLRSDRTREYGSRMGNLLGNNDPDSRAEFRRQAFFRDMNEDDAAADPYTGVRETAENDAVDTALSNAQTYFRPEVTEQREDEQALKRLLVGEPARVSGEAARDVAAITARSKASAESAGWAEPTVSIPDPYGTGGTYPVPRRIAADPVATRSFIDKFRDQGIGGVRGQADRSKIDAFNTLIDVMGRTYQQGEKIGWAGLGPISAGVLGPIYRKTGLFSNEGEESLRTQLGRVRTREAFGEGGKAFTGTEERLVDSFLSSVYDNPAATGTRLDEGFAHAKNMLRNLGVSDDIIDARISAARGGGGDVEDNGADEIADPNWGAQ